MSRVDHAAGRTEACATIAERIFAADTWAAQRRTCAQVSDRERPPSPGVNGLLMARRPWPMWGRGPVGRCLPVTGPIPRPFGAFTPWRRSGWRVTWAALPTGGVLERGG